MAEYIEREALLENLKRQYGEDLGWQCTVNMSDVGMMIEDAPTADVVEVVRCKNCNHKVDFKGRVMCNRNAQKHGDEWHGLTATESNHFCSYGAKMDGKGECEC